MESPCELAELTARLPEAAKRIRKWVYKAEGDDLDLLLRGHGRVSLVENGNKKGSVTFETTLAAIQHTLP